MMNETGPTGLTRQKRLMPSLFARALSGIAFESVYEAFAGDAKLSLYFKREGKRVVCGDRLQCHHLMAQAYITNNHHRVPTDECQSWNLVVKDAAIANRFAAWTRHGMTPEETIWLGLWHHHLNAPAISEYSRAIGVSAIGWILRHWLARHHERTHHPKQLLAYYVQRLNSWVCDNGQEHVALWGDSLQDAPGVASDLLVCYPPTASGSDNPLAHIWMHESWINGGPSPVYPKQSLDDARFPVLGTRLTAEQYERALTRFFARVSDIPIWAIGFNNAEPLGVQAIKAVVEKFRPVRRMVSCPVAVEGSDQSMTEYVLIAR